MNNEPTTNEQPGRIWAIVTHLGAFGGIIFPFGNIILPLIIWAIHKKTFPFVDQHGKESINFQISMTIYSIVGLVLIHLFIGFLVLPALVIINIVFVIIASIAASKNEAYKYTLSIRLIK